MMRVIIFVTVEVDEKEYGDKQGIPVSEVPENIADEFTNQGDALTWDVKDAKVVSALRLPIQF